MAIEKDNIGVRANVVSPCSSKRVVRDGPLTLPKRSENASQYAVDLHSTCKYCFASRNDYTDVYFLLHNARNLGI